MIKIYEIVDDWGFPIDDIDYLKEEHMGERFILIDNKLYEIEEIENIEYLKRNGEDK